MTSYIKFFGVRTRFFGVFDAENAANAGTACYHTDCFGKINRVFIIIRCVTSLEYYDIKQNCLSRVVMVTDEKPQILNCNILFYFK